MSEADGPFAWCPAWIEALLRRAEMVPSGVSCRGQRLTGGVSSDIWRAFLPSGTTVCAKRALPSLRVEAGWEAPITRSGYEVRYLVWAGRLVPGFVPRVLASDHDMGAFVMEDVGPGRAVWKNQLLDGRVDCVVAASLARNLVAVHAGTAHDPACAATFATGDLFEALRLEPYLRYTAAQHPEHHQALELIAATLADTELALVHGDVSPKNVLVGPDRVILLDAECATYGDPAFDVAFCATHLLLKCLWRRPAARRLLAALDTFVGTYLSGVGWEATDDLEQRAARVLPALLLARVDGRSPVEYLNDGAREFVRAVAGSLLLSPARDLAAVAASWREALQMP